MGLVLSRTLAGHLAHRLATQTVALMPARDEGLGIWSCYPPRAPERCDVSDFSYMIQKVADEAEFEAFVADMVEHEADLRSLPRPTTNDRIPTMWGLSHYVRTYADGIVEVGTEEHGGFILSRERNERVHEAWRAENGQYEEDLCRAIVTHTFPDLFTKRERRSADETLKHWMPDQWEIVTGQKLQPGESRERDRATFRKENADRLIVLSAAPLDGEPDHFLCSASLGGDWDAREKHSFLVPRSEYYSSKRGLVIDEVRHRRV